MIRNIKVIIISLIAVIACDVWAVGTTKLASDTIVAKVVADSTNVNPLDTIKIKTVTLGNRLTMNLDSIELEPSLMFLPLIFEKYEAFDESVTAIASKDDSGFGFDAGDQWLVDAQNKSASERKLRYHTMINTPQINRHNLDELPEPPKQYEIVADPSSRTLELEQKELGQDLNLPEEQQVIKVRNWLHSFDGSIQFSQAYMSDNWYQGGNNNLNVIGNFIWNVSLNTNKYPNLLFDNTVQYKIGLASAPQDSLRSYSISEDLFQVNSKFGYKAIKNWYYSMTLLFKTQLLNNYTANTNTLTASFLTPGELNLGLGMTYSTKSKDGYLTFDMSISPLSYNMKICRENTRVDPTTMGVDEGRHFAHEIGSSFEGKMTWKITPAISWTSRLYAFSNYEYLQGDWENTFNFSVNKYLSTQFYVHLRYDKSASYNESWRYWQFKEILSFGLTYKFSMK